MQTTRHHSAFRAHTLHRLTNIAATLTQELSSLPSASALGVDALSQSLKGMTPRHPSQSLKQKISDYWAAPSANGMPRLQLFALAMDHSLRDELALKTADGTLHQNYWRCLTGTDQQASTASALSLQLNEQAVAEIAGALVMTAPDGHTLLSIPGFGLEAFGSRQLMFETLTSWINNPTLRMPLLRNIEQRLAQAVLTVEQDADLFLEPFKAQHWCLTTIDKQPFAYALSRQIHKQQADIEHAVATPYDSKNLSAWRASVNQAIRMPRLFGPEAMIELLDTRHVDPSRKHDLPDWFKIARPEDRQHYIEGLQTYEQSRAVLTSAMSGAQDLQQYASIRLHARIENDLGYDLNPNHLIITTQRSFQQVGEAYQISRNLTQLSLYGLHPGDRLEGSEFLNRSQCTLDDIEVAQDYPDLTLSYIAALIDELDLRASFRPFQRETYGSAQVQQLMCVVMRLQLKSLAHAAQLQGHIRRADYDLIAALDEDIFSTSGTLLIQRLNLARKDTLSSTLVFRVQGPQSEVERLILFTPDKPGAQFFQAFDTERQMLHEIVSWSASTELSQFLLGLVAPAKRPALQTLLDELHAKPQPAADFLTFVTLQDYDQGLRSLALSKSSLSLAEHSVHTPDWYLRASHEQRQALVAREDLLAGAQAAYKSKPHTHVPEFETYVQQRARKKINALLGLPALDVDPEQIIVTSPREQLSYTQLLRNGYDDSVGFFNETLEGRATFSGPPGVDLSALTAEKVARSVRGQWLSDDYIRLIKDTLLNPQDTGYEYRRSSSLLITRLQMSAAALRSYLEGHINTAQFTWLSRSIDWMHLNDPMTRERSPFYPLQFNVRTSLLASGIKELDDAVDILKDLITLGAGPDITHVETVQGCYVLMPDDSRDIRHALLYTPQAPDGEVFRPFDSFLDTLKRKGMSDYYKDRCRLKANRALAFFLHDMKQSGSAHKPALPSQPHMDLQDACFNRKLLRKIRDVEETTDGRSDMISKLVWDSIEWVAMAVTLPFPMASFTVGAALVLRDSAHAFKALSEGDHEAASGYVLSSALNALGAAGDLHAGIKGFGSVLRDLTAPANRHAVTAKVAQLKRWPTIGDLRPVDIQGELLWAAKPNQAGHAALFRSLEHPLDELRPTGQFAQSNNLGRWSPIEPVGAKPLPSTSRPHIANADYAVNVSLADTVPISKGHAEGVTLLAGKHYISLDEVVYQVHFDSRAGIWQIVDPGNPYAFFGKQPVRLNEQGHWQVIDSPKLRGGMPGKFKPLTEQAASSNSAVGDISDYELPSQFRHFLPGILYTGDVEHLASFGLGLEEVFSDFIKLGRENYATLRQNLRRDALSFFENVPPIIRPELPALAETADPETVIVAIFEKTNGLVISEAPTSVASKQWLIENMQQLAEQKTEILYIQHLLTDQHTHKLQKYKALGKKTRSGSHNIKEHLECVNDGALKNGSSTFDYYHLIKAAHRYGIEVKPLNSSVSYSFKSYEQATQAAEALNGQKMSTFFGHKVINADLTQKPGRRWIALVDHPTASQYQGLPGISELEGAISLRIEQAPPGQPAKISRDASLHAHGSAQINADFTLELTDLAGASKPQAVAEPATTALDDALYDFVEDQRLAEWGVDPRAQQSLIKDSGLSHTYAGEQGFELKPNGQWTRADAKTWESERPLNAIQQSLIDPHYQVAAEARSRLHDLANFQHRGLHDNYFFADADIATFREAFFDIRAELAKDAKTILTAELPPRPDLPEITPQMPLRVFMEKLYKSSTGVVLGEAHASVASKKLLIDHFEHLAAQDVKTLYMEHLLTDLHQADLDRFAETGQMSKTLMYDLKTMDKYFHTDPNKVYTFENLVIKAREHGIEVRAIDCAASYYVKSMSSATETTRQEMMSFFASRTIRRHQEVMGQHKWIALVGNTHANTYLEVVPGLAELEQAIGVRILDVQADAARGAMRDPGEVIKTGLGESDVFLKSDYRVEIPMQPRAPIAVPVESRLYNPGMFLIDQSQPTQPVILHRSRDMTIQQTRVRENNDGTLYVEREGWPSVHKKPFSDLSELTEALKTLNLKDMG
jgi:hypothetical protein